MVRGIRIDPGMPPRICKVPDTAQGLDALLGGHSMVKCFSFKDAALVYLPHDERNTLPTLRYDGRWYYGTLLVLGWKGGRALPLKTALADELAETFARREVPRL